MNIKSMRNIHLYLGCFFAPLLIFFLITGAWQMFDWHKDSRKAGGYKALTIVKVMSDVHTSQQIARKTEHPKFTMVMRYLIVLMSLGLLITTLLGVIMAFKYTHPWLVWACLAGGIGIPSLLLLLAHGF